MNSRQLFYITKVAETGSISKAAEELHISQPSLSQMIRAVEKSLGTTIFNRDKSPTTLTYAGEKYVAAARKILQIEGQLLSELSEITLEQGGKIRLGISMHRAIAFLPEILMQFKKEYPNVEVEIHELGSSSLEQHAYLQNVDLAFSTTGQNNSDMVYLPILVEKIFLVAGKNTAISSRIESGKKIKIKEAREEEFVVLKSGHAIRSIQDQLFSEYKILPRVFCETDSIELAKKMALFCDKVALYPEIVTTHLNMMYGGSYYEIERPRDFKTFCLCYHKDIQIKKYMQRFIDISMNHLKKEQLCNSLLLPSSLETNIR
ncbi:MAG: LysR family transcriptional regulator [Peptostreptococcaceae bacterium]|nr:LysR family transcriptional regulator [Peptostreptococcaceae bacterium]